MPTTDKFLNISGLQRLWATIVQCLSGKADQTDMDAAELAITSHAASIATVEQATATANHAVGDYFMLGNVLMRATAAIATGEQITTSNATPATVQGQIDSLRESVNQSDTVTCSIYRLGTVSPITLHGRKYGSFGIFVGSFTAGTTSETGQPYMQIDGNTKPGFGYWRVDGNTEGVFTTSMTTNNVLWFANGIPASKLSEKLINIMVIVLYPGFVS